MKKNYLLYTILLLQISYSNAQLQLNDFITRLDDPHGLVVHGGDLYFSGIDNKIYKVNTQIQNPSPIEIFQGGTQLRCLAVDNDILYFRQGSKISRINLAETNPTVSDLATNIYAYGLAIKGNELYIAERDENRISKIDITLGNQSPTTVKSNLNAPSDIVLKDNDLFIAESSGNKISKIDLSETTLTLSNVVTGLNDPDDLLLVNNELYIVEQLSYKVSKIDLSESSITVEDVITNLAGPSGITFNDNCFYISQTFYVAEGLQGKISTTCSPSLSIINNYEANVTIFNNPTTKKLTVSGLLHKADYKVYNIFGVEITNGEVYNNEVINLNRFSSGIYFFKLNAITTKKIILK
ncbi:MAG: T9SS type A sorting domain-containing protein [Flavobacteriaceae bacterium]|nr:T9SS type A sorting domain-containing protein [Flavobacteriaceae bacterium]